MPPVEMKEPNLYGNGQDSEVTFPVLAISIPFSLAGYI